MTYNGYIENLPIPEAFRVPGIIIFGDPWIDPPPYLVAAVKKLNQESADSVQAVRDAETPADQLAAIQVRAKLIQERVAQLTEYGQKLSPADFGPDKTANQIATLLLAVPYVDIVVGAWKGLNAIQQQKDFNEAVRDTRARLVAYEQDAVDLAKLNNDLLLAEQRRTLATPVPTPDKLPIQFWWAVIGGIAILLIVWVLVSRRRR